MPSKRFKLLDLFCGAGGCSVGYHRAGFDVVGVDHVFQKNYPFEFHQADALEFVRAHGHEFDVIHASPPCQKFTSMSNRWRGAGGKADTHVDLIALTRAALLDIGRPYVIENVVGARRHMRGAIKLTGGAFGLRVQRARLFESSMLLHGYPCATVENPVGVYGAAPDGRRLWTRKDGTQQRAARSVSEAREAMGIAWMEWRELCEAIPPAYTEYIGSQLMLHLSEAA